MNQSEDIPIELSWEIYQGNNRRNKCFKTHSEMSPNLMVKFDSAGELKGCKPSGIFDNHTHPINPRRRIAIVLSTYAYLRNQTKEC
ncbi:MAG: hypothetical protein HC838_01520 [Spirulinaceae cyanobacterium RM2_2_10]|nr:hypothetical protein [Spirulinaceae cyanobacterium SM2_1_0]NJO19006.1 hypothetical protein [Spirulinaceae cyanobacterium RM2_2_10]